MSSDDVPEATAPDDRDFRSMIPPILLAQSDKIYAGLASLGVLLGGQWFIAASEEGGLAKYGALGCVAVCASVFTAFIKTRAGTIKARAEADASAAAILEAATNALIKRITDANDKREAQLAQDLDYARQRADTQEQIAQAHNEAKHNALEQLFAVMLHARNVEEVLRESIVYVRGLEARLRDGGASVLEHEIAVPEGPHVDLGKVVKSQDAKTSALLGDRADAFKKKTVRVELPATMIFRPVVRPAHPSPPHPNPKPE